MGSSGSTTSSHVQPYGKGPVKGARPGQEPWTSGYGNKMINGCVVMLALPGFDAISKPDTIRMGMAAAKARIARGESAPATPPKKAKLTIDM